jgi:xylose isomerase
MGQYDPKPEHKFTFGLWTIGNRGRDPFGIEVRDPLSPVDIVHVLKWARGESSR